MTLQAIAKNDKNQRYKLQRNLVITNRKHPRILPPIATVKGLILAICLFTIPATLQSCGSPARSLNITRAKDMQFRFEDYQTAEAAQNKLLELYPIGSDVSKFVKDMQSIGYKYLPPDDLKDDLKVLNFQHFIPVNAAGSNVWSVDAIYSNSKITELTVNYSFSSY
jgi:hypothetical protein